MPITEPMANPTDDWIPYQPSIPNPNYINQIQAPLSTIISTAAATTTATITTSTATASRNNPLSPNQGRISRPIRRRARASRRTPTTLLNTDTTNFRAMVQHFTGGPATAEPQLPRRPIPSGTTIVEPAVRFRTVEFANQMQQHLVTMDSMHGGGGGGGGGALESSSGYENWDYNSYMR